MPRDWLVRDCIGEQMHLLHRRAMHLLLLHAFSKTSAFSVYAAASVNCAARRCAAPRCDYQVRLPKPLGIEFEERQPGKAEGLVVAGLVEGGNAESDGRILVGDVLTRCSAVQFGGQSALLTVSAMGLQPAQGHLALSLKRLFDD